MNKVLCTLLFLAVLGIAQCESFKRISIDQGKISINRNLESLHKTTLESTQPVQTTVKTKIAGEFIKAAGLKEEDPTTMQIFLSTSESGFYYSTSTSSATSGSSFIPMQCKAPCKQVDTNQYVHAVSPNLRVVHGHRMKLEIETGEGEAKKTEEKDIVSILDGEKAVWTSKNHPITFSTVFMRTASAKVAEKSTNGFIGLGVEGDAAKNFATDSPIFTLKVDVNGKGDLIFGDDASSKNPLTWETNGNWYTETNLFEVVPPTQAALQSKSEKNVKVHFDLNQYETYLATEHSNIIFYQLGLSVNQTEGHEFSYYYDSTTKGPISKLPPIVMKFGEKSEKSVTIPFEALFRKTAFPGKFDFVVKPSGDLYGDSSKRDDTMPTTVFGTHFLSNFHAVFSAPKEKTPFVTLHPTYSTFDSGSTGGSGKFLIGLIAVIGLGAVGFIVFRNKAASKLAEHLNEK